MQRVSVYLVLTLLAGCTSSGGGSMNAPGSPATMVSYTAVNNSGIVSTGVDTRAINAAIRASDRPYWAVDEEDFQQAMDSDLAP